MKALNHSPAHAPQLLRKHLAEAIAFHHPRCIDPDGGYFQFFREDGSVHEPGTKHLVGSARMVVNYALASQLFGGRVDWMEAARHGLKFLRRSHRNASGGGYAWILEDGRIADANHHPYGLAFVLLAYAKLIQVGLVEARKFLYETWELLEKRFWEEEHGLYADEASPDWIVSGYRGQNANMHLCEAMLAAFEATGDAMFLARASLLADRMVNRQAAKCGGQVWEHYDRDWQPDWNYNKGDRTNIFRPWGFQPGHQVEWTKLLVQLDRVAPEPWRLERARELFDVAVRLAWDEVHGGLIYGYDPDGRPYDEDKYGWVQIESMAAAALLYARTGEAAFGEWYTKIAECAWRVFVDPRTGCWHRIRRPDGTSYGEPAPFSGLTDYHTFSACTDIVRALEGKGAR